MVRWEEKLDANEKYIFCANHVSTLDIPLIYAILPMPIQYIGKAEISKIPLFKSGIPSASLMPLTLAARVSP